MPRQQKERIAIYPGSFDPVTHGHMDLIRRGSTLFDRVVVAVARNVAKAPLFDDGERLAMIRELARDLPNVEVELLSGLVVDYARARGAGVILRGVRTFSDFEYEFQMALTNRTLREEIETVFMITKVEYSFVSSKLIKEVATMGGDVSSLVPALVEARLRAKLAAGSSAPAAKPASSRGAR